MERDLLTNSPRYVRNVNLFEMIEESLQKIASTQPYVRRLISKPSTSSISATTSRQMTQRVEYQPPNETRLYFKYKEDDSVRLMAKFRGQQIKELRTIKEKENQATELHRYSTDLFDTAVKRVESKCCDRPASSYKIYRELSNLSSKSDMSAYVLPIKDISQAQPDAPTEENYSPSFLPEVTSIRRNCLNEVRLKTHPTQIKYSHDVIAREIISEGELVSTQYTVPRHYQTNAYNWNNMPRPQLKDIANRLKTLYVPDSVSLEQKESLESFQETTLEEEMGEEGTLLGEEEGITEEITEEIHSMTESVEEKAKKGRKKKKKKEVEKKPPPVLPPKSPTLSSVSVKTKKKVNQEIHAIRAFINDFKKSKEKTEKGLKQQEELAEVEQGVEVKVEENLIEDKSDNPETEVELSQQITADENENVKEDSLPEEEEWIPPLPDFACPALPDKSRQYETRKWLHERVSLDIYS